MHTPATACRGVFSSAFDRFPGKRHLRAPLLRQVFRSRILRFNQSNFLRPYPALQLLLASDGFMDTLKAVVIYQAVAMILAGKALDFAPRPLVRYSVLPLL